MDTNTLEVKISSANARRRGITLIESVLAAAILAMAVMAVFSAIGAGTSHAQESARRIAGTMASEALLARVLINDGTDLEAWDGFSEPPGDLRDANHVLLAPAQQTVGRRVYVDPQQRTLPGFDPVEGYLVRVEAFDSKNTVLSLMCEWTADDGAAE